MRSFHFLPASNVRLVIEIKNLRLAANGGPCHVRSLCSGDYWFTRPLLQPFMIIFCRCRSSAMVDAIAASSMADAGSAPTSLDLRINSRTLSCSAKVPEASPSVPGSLIESRSGRRIYTRISFHKMRYIQFNIHTLFIKPGSLLELRA